MESFSSAITVSSSPSFESAKTCISKTELTLDYGFEKSLFIIFKEIPCPTFSESDILRSFILACGVDMELLWLVSGVKF